MIGAVLAILAYIAWIRYVDDPLWGTVTAITFWSFVVIAVGWPAVYYVRRRSANRTTRSS